jgi:hypothetical protein
MKGEGENLLGTELLRRFLTAIIAESKSCFSVHLIFFLIKKLKN